MCFAGRAWTGVIGEFGGKVSAALWESRPTSSVFGGILVSGSDLRYSDQGMLLTALVWYLVSLCNKASNKLFELAKNKERRTFLKKSEKVLKFKNRQFPGLPSVLLHLISILDIENNIGPITSIKTLGSAFRQTESLKRVPNRDKVHGATWQSDFLSGLFKNYHKCKVLFLPIGSRFRNGIHGVIFIVLLFSRFIQCI